MKSLKITNIILFILLCICQAFIVYVFIASLLALISGEAGGVLAVVLAYLPMFILAIFATCILYVALTITTKKLIAKKQLLSLNLSTFDKICKKLPLIFVVIDIFLLIATIVLVKVNN